MNSRSDLQDPPKQVEFTIVHIVIDLIKDEDFKEGGKLILIERNIFELRKKMQKIDFCTFHSIFLED